MAEARLRLDTADPTPPYEQIRRQLERLVSSRDLPVGSRLPPLRQVAGDLGVAVGTVARAYSELEKAGLLVSRRGGGTRVAQSPHPVPPADVDRWALDYVARTRAVGISDADALAAIHRATSSRT